MNPAFYYGGPDQSAFRAGIVIAALLCAYALWQLARWFIDGSPRPDPWSDEISDEIARDDTAPLCHRCLAPHDPGLDFCPDCGAAVGAYTNWLPYPYIFSVGHTLRIGTDGAFRRSAVTIAGFVLLALYQYTLFAPVYLFVFFKNLVSQPPSPAHTATSGERPE